MFTVMLIHVCSSIPKSTTLITILRNLLSLMMDSSSDQVLLKDITFNTNFPNLPSLGISIPHLTRCLSSYATVMQNVYSLFYVRQEKGGDFF